jgi:hypothetical protein
MNASEQIAVPLKTKTPIQRSMKTRYMLVARRTMITATVE